MTHFTKDFTKFFRELEKNNNRDWFNENKKRYEKSVKEPFQDFITEMLDKLQAVDSRIAITAKDAIFRIYRDVRFSKDKSPYKIHMAAILSPGGRKNMQMPGIYVQMNHKDVRLYSGLYQLDSKQLKRVREHIAGNLKEFNKLIKQKKFTNKFGEIEGEKHKRIPKEFAEIAEQQGLIANKQFYYFAKLKPAAILDKNFPKVIIDHYRASRPLGEFWEEALGI